MLRAPIDAPVSDDFHAHHPPERLARIQQVRLLNFALLSGLIVLGLAWELRLAPLAGGTGALAWKVLPLSLGLVGVLKHRLYTYRWLSLLVWLYVTEGLLRGTSESGLSQACAWVEVALATGLFIGCSVYVRLRLKVLPPKPGKGETAPPAKAP
ncbi:MAG: hypothetical protein RI907_1212 [Pseudomonadota bacterium]|jgi:uncharacterized membrane protein